MAFTVGELDVKIEWSKTDQKKFATDTAVALGRIEKQLPALKVDIDRDYLFKQLAKETKALDNIFAVQVRPVIDKSSLAKEFEGLKAVTKGFDIPVGVDSKKLVKDVSKAVVETEKVVPDLDVPMSVQAKKGEIAKVISSAKREIALQKNLDGLKLDVDWDADIAELKTKVRAAVFAANKDLPKFDSNIGEHFAGAGRLRFNNDNFYESYNLIRSMVLISKPLEASISGAFNAIDVSAKVFMGTLKGIGGVLGATAISAGVLGLAIGGIGVAGIAASKDLEQTFVAYRTLIGSTAEATKTFNDVLTLAKDTPFDVAELAKSGQRLLGAKFDPSQVVDGLKAIGGVAASVGATGENVDKVAIALAKISGRGKITMLELNSITRNLPGFNALAALSNELGLSLEDTQKRISKGKLGASGGPVTITRTTKDQSARIGLLQQELELQKQTNAVKNNTSALRAEKERLTLSSEQNKLAALQSKNVKTAADQASILSKTQNIQYKQLVASDKQVKSSLQTEKDRLSVLNKQLQISNLQANSNKVITKTSSKVATAAIDSQTAINAILSAMEEFPGAAEAMAAQVNTLSGALQNIKDVFTVQFFQAFKPFTKEFALLINEDFRDIMGELVGSFASSITPLADIVLSSIESFVPAIKLLVDPSISFLSDVAVGFQNIADGAVAGVFLFEDFVSGIGKGIADLGTNISDGIVVFFNAISDTWSDFSDSIGRFLSETRGFILGLASTLAPVVDLFTTLVDAVTTIIKKSSGPLFDSLKGVFETLNDIADRFDFSSVGGTINVLLDALSPLIIGLLPVLSSLLEGLQGLLEGFASGVVAATPYITEFFGTISSFLADNSERFGELVGVILVNFADLLSTIAPILTGFLEIVLKLPDPVLQFATAIGAVALALGALGKSEGLYATFRLMETLAGKGANAPFVKNLNQRALSAIGAASTTAATAGVAGAEAGATAASTGLVTGVVSLAKAHPYLTAVVGATAAAIGIYTFTIGKAHREQQEFNKRVLETTKILRDSNGVIDVSASSLNKLLFETSGKNLDLDKFTDKFKKLGITAEDVSSNFLDGADGLKRFAEMARSGFSGKLRTQFIDENTQKIAEGYNIGIEKEISVYNSVIDKYNDVISATRESFKDEITKLSISNPEIQIGIGGVDKILEQVQGLEDANAPLEDFRDLLIEVQTATELSGDKGKIFQLQMSKALQAVKTDATNLVEALNGIVEFKIPDSMQSLLDKRDAQLQLESLLQDATDAGLSTSSLDSILTESDKSAQVVSKLNESQLAIAESMKSIFDQLGTRFSTQIQNSMKLGVEGGLSLADLSAELDVNLASIQAEIDAMPNSPIKDALKKQYNPDSLRLQFAIDFNFSAIKTFMAQSGFEQKKNDPAFWATFLDLHPQVAVGLQSMDPKDLPPEFKSNDAFISALGVFNPAVGVEIPIGISESQVVEIQNKYSEAIKQVQLYGDANPASVPVILEPQFPDGGFPTWGRGVGEIPTFGELTGWGEGVKNTVQTVVDSNTTIVNSTGEALQTVASQQSTAVATVASDAQKTMQNVSESMYNNWYDRIRGVVWLTEVALQDIQSLFSSYFDGIRLTFDYFASVLSDRLSFIVSSVKTDFLQLIGIANIAVRGTNAIAEAVGSDIRVPEMQVPVFHDGGVVGGGGKTSGLNTNDSEVIAKLLIGERVLTREQASLVPESTWAKFNSGSLDGFVSDLNEMGYGVRKKDIYGIGGNIFDSGQRYSSTFNRDSFNDDFLSKLSAGVGSLLFTVPKLIGSVLEKLLSSSADKVNSVFSPNFDLSIVPGDVIGNLIRNVGVAGNYQAVIDYMNATGVPFVTTSTFRPFSITQSGALSYHAMGRAVDFAGLTPSELSPQLMDIFNALAALKDIIPVKELIYAGAAQNIKNGEWVNPYATSIHKNHVHFAFGDGGMVYPGFGGVPAVLAERGFPELVLPLGDANYNRRVDLLDRSGVTGDMMSRYYNAWNSSPSTTTNNTYNVKQELPAVYSPPLYASAVKNRLARL